jgi:hypothetical protein
MLASSTPNFASPVQAQPYSGAVAVAPSDGTPFARSPCRAIYVGTTGALVLVLSDGTTATFAVVPAGTILPLQASQVMATGTTASSIVALY